MALVISGFESRPTPLLVIYGDYGRWVIMLLCDRRETGSSPVNHP